MTIDAMGCQTKIAQAILDQQADYLLAVKDNWPALQGEIERYFADPRDSDLDQVETTDGEHGRIEIRRHVVSQDVAWLTSDRRFPGEPRSPGLTTIAMIEAVVEREGRISRDRRYFLSSAPLDARLFAHAVRCHWHVENRLHWVLDVVFHDDLCRLRSGFGPQNMAVIKHMALNLVRHAPGKHSLAVRRKKASWNPDYLEAILRQRT